MLLRRGDSMYKYPERIILLFLCLVLINTGISHAKRGMQLMIESDYQRNTLRFGKYRLYHSGTNFLLGFSFKYEKYLLGMEFSPFLSHLSLYAYHGNTKAYMHRKKFPFYLFYYIRLTKNTKYFHPYFGLKLGYSGLFGWGDYNYWDEEEQDTIKNYEFREGNIGGPIIKILIGSKSFKLNFETGCLLGFKQSYSKGRPFPVWHLGMGLTILPRKKGKSTKPWEYD